MVEGTASPTSRSPAFRIRSPTLMSDFAAGEPTSTWLTIAPCGLVTQSEAAISGVTSWQATPIHGRATDFEPATACATTVRTMSAGMAKPMRSIRPCVRRSRC